MTPRDIFDSDDVSASTTPRATSPRLPGNERGSPAPVSILRRDSSTRQASPLFSNTPQFISRPLNGRRTPDAFNGRSSPEKQSRYRNENGRFTPDVGVNGRFTPEAGSRPVNGRHGRNSSLTTDAEDSFMDFGFGTPPDSSILGARLRPSSPGSSGAYQSMTLAGGSRPSTPSNVTWKLPTTPPSNADAGHSRNGSAVSTSEMSERSALPLQGRRRSGSVPQYGHGRNGTVESTDAFMFEHTTSPMSAGRSLRSPPLPDSPFIDGGANLASELARSGSVMSGMDLNSPVAAAHRAAMRSPTPTGYPPASPASPTFSDVDRSNSRANSRSGQYASRQGAPSPFTLNQSHALLLSPIANSSRSSLESTGSSYHSWEGEHKQERVLPLLASLEPPQTEWHELLITDKLSAGTGGDAAEGIIQHYVGLSKGDLAAIQERLVFAANVRSEANDIRDRGNSHRRRRPSTSQTPQLVTVKARRFIRCVFVFLLTSSGTDPGTGSGQSFQPGISRAEGAAGFRTRQHRVPEAETIGCVYTRGRATFTDHVGSVKPYTSAPRRARKRALWRGRAG
jgi:serine/arginine repetitive matrix protein 2